MLLLLCHAIYVRCCGGLQMILLHLTVLATLNGAMVGGTLLHGTQQKYT